MKKKVNYLRAIALGMILIVRLGYCQPTIQGLINLHNGNQGSLSIDPMKNEAVKPWIHRLELNTNCVFRQSNEESRAASFLGCANESEVSSSQKSITFLYADDQFISGTINRILLEEYLEPEEMELDSVLFTYDVISHSTLIFEFLKTEGGAKMLPLSHYRDRDLICLTIFDSLLNFKAILDYTFVEYYPDSLDGKPLEKKELPKSFFSINPVKVVEGLSFRTAISCHIDYSKALLESQPLSEFLDFITYNSNHCLSEGTHFVQENLAFCNKLWVPKICTYCLER